MKTLILVDKAVATTGPHRNVVGTIQALAARDDVALTVMCGSQDLDPAVSSRLTLIPGFDPHDLRRIPRNLRGVRRAMRECDVVYVPTGLKTFLYAWLLKGSKPLVAGPNVTGIPLLMDKYNPGPLMTVRMSDAWIEMSETRARHCVAAGTPRSKIHIVPHSVDAAFFSPERRDRSVWPRLGIAPEATVILYTGRVDDDLKGIPELIEAFRSIHRERPDAVLVLVGPIQRNIDEYRSVPNVLFMGPKSGAEFATLVASADLFMAASRSESFWFCPLEAMSSGLPVIVSETGAVPEMIPENGVQGFRVPVLIDGPRFRPDAAKLLADQALALLREPEKRRAIGLAARTHVAREFSEAKLAERLVAVFRSVLDRRS